MYEPDLETLRRLAGVGRLAPLYREVLADLETPVSAYLKVAGRRPGFLLESVEGGEHVARWSFVGAGGRGSIELGEEHATFSSDGSAVRLPFGDPLDLIDGLVRRAGVVRLPGLPRFVGGAVGYLSYEVARRFERLPTPAADPYGLPLGQFLLVDTLLVFDHLKRTIKVVTHVPLDGDLQEAYRGGVERIEELLDRLATAPTGRRGLLDPAPNGAEPAAAARANVDRSTFEAMVRTGKEHIAAGDVIQVVLAQRLSVPALVEPFVLYRALRAINPSPYMYFLDFGSHQLIGASPELLVLVENGQVTTHPIAGTRPRGRTPDEDARLADELRGDEKERAEHVMLVDLGRNDLGRVSEPGTVRVPRLMEVERYSHVMHLVSQVTGRLRPELRAVDALRACFPAGTVSGAPKIRAMEIIAELEPERRGPYAGAVGFFGFGGDLEMAITIRTIVLKDGVAHVQAGAGIVADSDPAAEYCETLNKAAALLKAVGYAEQLAPAAPVAGGGR